MRQSPRQPWRLKKIKAIVAANPLGRICEIRIEAQKILGQYGDDNKTILRLIEPLAREEKEMFALAKKQVKNY